MTDEFSAGYLCPGFYPIAARDITHAASLFAIWAARRKLGPSAGWDQLVLHEELVNGARFQVRAHWPERLHGENYFVARSTC